MLLLMAFLVCMLPVQQVEATFFLLGLPCLAALRGLDAIAEQQLRDLGAGPALGRVQTICEMLIDGSAPGLAYNNISQIRQLISLLGSGFGLSLGGDANLSEVAEQLIRISGSFGDEIDPTDN